MSTGQYTHVTRNAGEIVSADLYNGAHRNQQQNDIPTSAGAHSDDLTEFQATTDPEPGGVATPVVSLSEEIEQLRFVLADIKTVLNDGTPPAEWYTPVTFDATLVQARGAGINRSTSQSITQDTLTAISFDTVDWDTGVALPTFDPFFSIAQPTRLTARATGVYQINGCIAWAAGVISGALRVGIRVNGTTNIAATAYPAESPSVGRFQEVGTQFTLNENDYVELIVYQNAAASLSVSSFSRFRLELLTLSSAFVPPTLRTLNTTSSGDGTGTITGTAPSTINCPGVCTEDFVDGSTVELTATPTVGVFGGWTGDVPIGDENDNPLTLTMDQDRNVNAIFNVFAAWLTVGTNGPASTFTPSTTNPFFDIGLGNIDNTAVECQRMMPVQVTVDRIHGRLGVALVGAQTVTVRLNINGVGDNTLTKVLTSADGVLPFSSAISPVVLAQDDLVCWEVTAFGGGLTTVAFTDLSLRYSGTGGFLVGRCDFVTVSGNTELPGFGTGSSTSLTFVNAAWIPKQVVISEGTMRADAATGAGTSMHWQFRTNNGASNTGSLMTLADPATTVRVTINATLPGTTTGVTADNHDALRSDTGAPASVQIRPLFAYRAVAPDEAFSFYFTGRTGFNHAGLGVNTPFPCIFGFNTSGAYSTTQAGAEIVWPVTGKFKYFGARGGTTAGTSFVLELLINGVVAVTLPTFSGTTTFQSDYVTEVSVTAGDRVTWRCNRTVGASVNLDLVAFLGFVTT